MLLNIKYDKPHGLLPRGFFFGKTVGIGGVPEALEGPLPSSFSKLEEL